MIVTGEASGDVHAAELLTALRKAAPNLRAFGMGSTHLKQAGMEILVDSAVHGSVMGLTEVFSAFGGILSAFRSLVKVAKLRKPDVLIVLDFPDFNMRLARALKAHTGKRVYFISPQVWAWRTGRVKSLKRDFSKIIPIFPFEEVFFKKHDVDAKWLGHPFLDHLSPVKEASEYLSSVGLDSKRPTIALLPGSRKTEVERLAKCMLNSFSRVASGRPGVQGIVPVASSLDMDWVKSQFACEDSNLDIIFVKEDVRQVLSSVDTAIVASGTATLEAAMCEVPFAIVYKISAITYTVGKALVKGTKFIGMPNIVSGKEVAREFIQDQCSAGAIAAEIERILADEKYRNQIKQNLIDVRNKLSYQGVDKSSTTMDRVAHEIISLATGAKLS
ncbi:UNVERIFIED_CONTAM: hypothetical protein GTU68_057014 [Idotea baltica]|nr:hypothetical protein [Idotea baltica]